jgi:hypothetical protein
MINDLKELQKFFKLCRAQGIIEIEMNDVKVKFGDLPIAQEILEPIEKSIDEQVTLTSEIDDIDPMAFYSAPRVEQ